MSAPLNVTVDGVQREVEPGTPASVLYEGRPEVVATKVNGELKDLFAVPAEGDVLEPVLLDSEDGFHVLRHSAAHVMAQAVGRLFPGAKYGIGPDIKDGFYYDFDVERPFTPEDLKAIEKEMQKIVNEGQHFERVVVSEEECHQVLADQPYKLELVVKKGGGGKAEDIAEGADLEVGGTELTFYHNVNRKGERTWGDLCRGPHLPTTKLLGANFKLMRSASAYWLGSEKNKQLQRIYGTAWASKDQLKDYIFRMEEAAKRDHRKLGAELDLFSFPEEIGSGLPIFHPKGGVIKKAMEDYVRERHVEEGFLYVGTPHISKEGLFHTSGHLPYYEDTMFPSMNVDEVVGDDGEVIKPGQRYFLKAMNCPMHNLIYKSQQRSYRDLPLRYFEFGRVHRYEKSGVVHGLTRVRGFDQDDSHSYVTEEQAPAEIEHLLKFILGLLKDFGMSDYYLEVSTRSDDPEKAKKFMGSDEQWAAATAVLQKVADESGLRIVPDPGGAAFYGPKISIKALDAIGREWQMSTIQYDFNQPERFGLEYVDSDGARKRPVMIHSAKFGSIERFMGVLVEHYAGQFPVWLAPVQALLVPVAEEYVPYLEGIAAQLREKGIRVELDASDDRFPKKIRNASKSKVPYTLIAGEEDRSKNAVSFRYRNGEQENGVSVEDAIAKIVTAIETRAQA